MRIRDISRAAGISERTFRSAFHREHGVSPKQYELRERLRAVHAALSDAKALNVTDVASQYGFFELGRFAGIYKSTFGELPSQTLRGRHEVLPREVHRGRRERST